jgi:hypothetical protein
VTTNGTGNPPGTRPLLVSSTVIVAVSSPGWLAGGGEAVAEAAGAGGSEATGVAAGGALAGAAVAAVIAAGVVVGAVVAGGDEQPARAITAMAAAQPAGAAAVTILMSDPFRAGVTVVGVTRDRIASNSGRESLFFRVPAVRPLPGVRRGGYYPGSVACR